MWKRIDELATKKHKSGSNAGATNRRCTWVREEGAPYQNLHHPYMVGVCGEVFED